MGTLSAGYRSPRVRLVFLVTLLFFVAGCSSLSPPPPPQQTGDAPLNIAPVSSPEPSVFPPAAPSVSESSPLTDAGSTVIELIKAYQILAKGDLVHNIPRTAKIDEAFIVDAGIAEEVTESVLEELGISGNVTIEQEVTYSPLKVELKLITNSEDAFEIQSVSAGQRVVIANSPGQWKWIVKPIKSGEYTLSIQYLVSLKSTNDMNKDVQTKPKILASQIVEVKSTTSNFRKSFSFLFTNNWLLILTVVTSLSCIYIGWRWGSLSGVKALKKYGKSF